MVSELECETSLLEKWLVDFNAGKTQLALFDRSYNTRAIVMKMDGLFLKKSNLLRCWGCFSFLN